jgi:hypothetical protein
MWPVDQEFQVRLVRRLGIRKSGENTQVDRSVVGMKAESVLTACSYLPENIDCA